METLHSYMNVKTFGTCALLLVLTTLPVNTGVRDSLKSRITKRNTSVYFCGCPCLACHIIYNTAHKAGEAFTQSCGFDVKDFTIDLFDWFDKSNKKGKNEFLHFCEFCD